MISVIALGLALVLALLEQRRANREAAKAKALAEGAKLEERRKLREQRAIALAQANAGRRREVKQFVAAVRDIFDTFIAMQGPDMSGGWWGKKEPIIGALTTLATSAPRDPKLLLIIHNAIEVIARGCAAEALILNSGRPARETVLETIEELKEVERNMLTRQRELLALYARSSRAYAST